MKNAAVALILMAGICLASSEGPMFPLPNLLGVVLVVLAGVCLYNNED